MTFTDKLERMMAEKELIELNYQDNLEYHIQQSLISMKREQITLNFQH